MCPAAGAVLFLEGDHVAGTHRTPVTLAASSQSDASQCSFREGAIIVRKFEMRLWLEGLVVGPQTQVLGGKVGVNNFVRIQFIVGIPNRFEFTESHHQLGSEHFGQQCATRLAVAMLTGKRSSVANYQVSGPLDELTIFTNANLALQIKTYAHVYATMPKMSVERASILVFSHQLPNVASGCSQIFPGHGRV